ncbi:MAG: PD40 domain-containing protein [Verrucomicrobia bacterium]|nr:PD40 domain-containing protein [Verrucomicrobiota bacterium]
MKNLSPLVLAAVIIGSVLTPTASAAESLSVLLQKGIYAEETEGNLDAAIKIYEQIGAEAATNRAVVAQAQYRLAMCYQKKGNKEQAIITLNELLKQFPSDAALGQKARGMLTALGQATSDAVTIRKLPFQGWVLHVSPDGRFVSHMPNQSYDMAIGDTATGKSWVAVKGESKDEKFPWTSRFSADSRLLAYELSGSIWVMANTEGAEAREIHKGDGKAGSIEVLGWSQDNAQLVIGSIGNPISRTKTASLSTLDVKSGSVKEIQRKARPNQLGGVHLSGNGRYLAYWARPEGETQRKIFVTDLQSLGVATVVDREVTDVIGWSPGDAKLVFSSDRTGTMGAWAIAMRDGKPSGEAELVKANIGDISPVGITNDGNFYYVEARSTDTVYTATADFQTGEISGQLRRVTERFPGVQTHPVWSKDGQKLMIAIQRGQKRFVAISLASGGETDFPVQTTFGGYPIQKFAWSQNGDFLLVQSVYAALNKSGIHRYDLSSGKTEPIILTESGKNWNSQPRLAPDEKSFYYGHREFFEKDGKTDWKDQIIRRDLRSGEEEIVHAPAEKLQASSAFDLSPDGVRLAVVTSDQFVKDDFVAAIKVVGLNGAEYKEVVRMAPRENVTSLAWTPDGKRIVYTKAGIWATDVDSGKTVKLKLSLPGMRNISIHPDGRQIAFQSASSGGRDLWVMEGLLSMLTTQSSRETKN